MNDLFSLQGKRILITGAGQGIGFVMAQGLAQYGAEIIINDLSAPRADDAVMKPATKAPPPMLRYLT